MARALPSSAIFSRCFAIFGLVFAACAIPEEQAGTAAVATRYAQTCAVCHDEGVRGAPVPGVEDDWSFRLEYGVEELYLNTIEGMGEMPPRGACSDCTDAELKAIVDFMLGPSVNQASDAGPSPPAAGPPAEGAP